MKTTKLALTIGILTSVLILPGCKKTPVGIASGQIDEPCKDNSECADGLICSDGICSQSCQNDKDCSALNRYCQGGRCLARPDITRHKAGEACTNDDECEDGLGCYQNICTKTCENKEDCGDGYDCVTGYCELNPCGNGILEDGEACDDHNNLNGDGCSAACTKEDGWECTAVTGATSVCSKLCGNGRQDGSETCDDGNSDNKDGCKNDCTIDQNYQCAGWPSVCSCKDGYQDADSDGSCLDQLKEGEACTLDGECEDGLGCYQNICTKTCKNKEDCGDGYNCVTGYCELNPCGNGILEDGEACDDHNNLNGDGCSAACTKEDGWECTAVAGATSVCSKLCGNGRQDGSEECDDGNSDNNDGCKNDCSIDQNYQCSGWPSVCSCKDGYQDADSDGSCLADCDSSCNKCVYSASGLASCRDYQACQDDTNPATCSCVIYVIKDKVGGTGMSWESPLGSLDDALDLLADKRADSATKDTFADCWIWLDQNQYTVANTYELNDVKIAGGFCGDESWLDERAADSWTKFVRVSTNQRLFNIKGSVTMNSLFIGNDEAISGNIGSGALYGDDFTMLRLVNCAISDNVSNVIKTYGIAAYLKDGQVEIENCIFKNNHTATVYSYSALYLDGTSAHISNSVFTGNYVDSNDATATNGGAIYLKGGILNLENSKFADNSLGSRGDCNGAAIYNDNGELNGTRLQFIKNRASSKNTGKQSSGGAIYSTGANSKLFLNDVIFVDNTISKSNSLFGGSIYNATPKARLENISITAATITQSSDTAKVYGAGIYNNAEDLRIMNGIFSDLSISSNVATPPEGSIKGSVIYNDSSTGTVKVGYSAFYQNTILGQAKDYLYNSGTDSNGVKAYLCLLDSATNDNKATFYESVVNIRLPRKELAGDNFQFVEYDAHKTSVKLASSENHWTPGELVGQYFYYENESTATHLSYPILENGENYIVIAAADYQPGAIPIIIVDWHEVTDSNDSQNKIIDKAEYNDYFDPLRDIFGTERPLGAANDIGPVEIR